MNHLQALDVADHIAQGQGAHYSMADLGTAARVLITATGEYDINTSPVAYAAYRTIARYQSARRLRVDDGGWR
jgi:hypothetical protein